MKIVGIFIGVIYGWIFIELIWPSIFSMIALALMGYDSIAAIFTAGFSYYLVPILIMCYLISYIFERSKASEYVASWLVSRKILIGKPFVLAFIILFASQCLGILGGGFAGIFIMWGMVTSLAKEIGYDRSNGYICFLMATIVPAVIFGDMILPFKAGPVMDNGFFANATGLTVNMGKFFVFQMIFVTLFLAACVLVLKFVLRPEVGQLQTTDDRFGYLRNQTMTKDQKIGFAFLIGYIGLLIAPSILPKTFFLTKLISSMGGVLGVTAFMVILGAVLRKSDGSSFCDIQKASDGISWSVIWLIIATIPLTSALQNNEYGIMPTIMGFLTPLLGEMNPTLFCICCMILMALITQVVHNLILAIVFIPIFCNMSISMGGNPYVCYIMIYWALTLAFSTPAASMNAAIMHGNEWVAGKKAYIYGLLYMVIGCLILIVVGVPLLNVFF